VRKGFPVKIVALVKRVPDTASIFKVAEDGKSVDTADLKYIMSPYDEYAVSEAVKLKEAHQGELVAVTYGPREAGEVLRTALAMGADSGLHIVVENGEGHSCKASAQVLAAALKPLGADLILAGRQAVDDDASQVPERVAALLAIPHASIVTSIAIDGAHAAVHREIEGGYYVLDLSLPALITMQKTATPPKYPSLPNIMKAKKKPIEETSAGALGLGPADLEPGISTVALSLPRQERLGQILEGETADKVSELVRTLREHEKVF